MKNTFLKNKVILVTGGSGSIGSEIVRQCLASEAAVVRVFSRDESRQYQMQQSLGKEFSEHRLRFLLGDIRDRSRLKRAMEGADIVFHAAALKQVPFCEYNPFEAVQTNVIGAQNLVESALDAKVQKVVAVSTDKAVNPINTMGATKLLSERIVTRANLWATGTVFSCVRFGNVFGSRGSALDLIEQQVIQNEPVQLTDKRMTRFMMSIPDAANLVISSAVVSCPGETFVLPMKALRVPDFIEELRDYFCLKHKKDTCDIIEVGCRPGEKLKEELLTEDELSRVREIEGFYVIENIEGFRDRPPTSLETSQYLSDQGPFMSREEIQDMFRRGGLT